MLDSYSTTSPPRLTLNNDACTKRRIAPSIEETIPGRGFKEERNFVGLSRVDSMAIGSGARAISRRNGFQTFPTNPFESRTYLLFSEYSGVNPACQMMAGGFPGPTPDDPRQQLKRHQDTYREFTMGCVLSTRPGGHQTTSSDRTASNAGSLVMRGRLREAANAAIMGSWSSGIGELGKVGQPSESKAQVRRSPAPRTTWRISSTIARGCGIGIRPWSAR